MSTAQEQFVAILSMSAKHVQESLTLTQNAATRLNTAASEASAATRTDLAARATTAAGEIKTLNAKLAALQKALQDSATAAAQVGRRAA